MAILRVAPLGHSNLLLERFQLISMHLAELLTWSDSLGDRAFSPNTPRRWARKDMSARARALRLKNCGHRRLLSNADQQVAAGWFISRCIRRLPTTTANARGSFSNLRSTWTYCPHGCLNLLIAITSLCVWGSDATEVRGPAATEPRSMHRRMTGLVGRKSSRG